MDYQKIMGVSITTLVIIISVVLVLWFWPSGEKTAPVSTETDKQESIIDLKVFESQGYQNMNKQPITDGSLPVQPPAQTGKANPFL